MASTDTEKYRTPQDVAEMLKLAKLSENDLLPTAQIIYFSNTSHSSNEEKFKFLELDSSIQADLKEGQTLFIKGDDNEDAVICSKNRTYEVTSGETSNSLLLVDHLKLFKNLENCSNENRSLHKVEVLGIFQDFLTVVPSKPRLRKLTFFLNKGVYKGPEHEYKVQNDDLYTLDDLKRTIQASDEELERAVDSLPIVKINSKLRLLDPEYHILILNYMLKLIDENSWALDEVDFDETVSALKDLVPEDILLSLFDKYTEETKIIDGLQLYRYKEADVCRITAQALLRGGNKYPLDEFIQVWCASVPEGMQTKEEYLRGIAIIDTNKDPQVIFELSEEDLPENINDRFSKLFKIKEKWTVPEISPYIQSLATDKLNVNALLAKYARASNVHGVKFYSSKHGK